MLARAYAPMQYINNFFRVCLVWAHAKRIIVYVWKILIDVVVVYVEGSSLLKYESQSKTAEHIKFRA